MTSIAVRLPDDLVAAVDALVSAGRYPTRSEAVRASLKALLDAHHQAEIDRRIVAAYTEVPQTDDEVAIAAAATRALINEEPW